MEDDNESKEEAENEFRGEKITKRQMEKKDVDKLRDLVVNLSVMGLVPFNHTSKPCVRELYDFISHLTWKYKGPIDMDSILPERRFIWFNIFFHSQISF